MQNRANRPMPVLQPRVAAALQPRASQPVEAGKIARERELHIIRLASIERGKHQHHRPARAGGGLRAGSGPDRPWAQPPPSMPGPKKAGQYPCAKGAPRAAAGPRPRSAPVLSRPGPADHLHQEHQRNVASLFAKLNRVHQGVEWQSQRHHDAAMASGRAQHSTKTTRQRHQRELKAENKTQMRQLRGVQARFATPAEIALLTGKPMPGADSGGDGGGGDDGSDE